MNLKYLLKKSVNIKTSYVVAIIVAALVVIGACFSYALFTVRSESKGALNIVTGNLYSYIESVDLTKEKTITIEPGDSKIITLRLLNVNSIEVKANMYYTATSSNVDVAYLEKSASAPGASGEVLGANGSGNDSREIDIRITNNDLANPVTVTFGSDVGLANAELVFPTGKNVINLYEGNPYIIRAYNYNDDASAANYCMTGEEETCEVTECYKSTTENACAAGTIFKYKVSDAVQKVFYVIEDKGSTMTLQQRENTVSNVAWYSEGSDNTKGPLTILASLEEATKDWDNVKEQTYTMGTTVFKDNAFTGCSAYNTCSTNAYTMSEKVANARMITTQEAAALNCTGDQNSCPKWMNNYLFSSKTYGGTVEDNTPVNEKHNYGYWTMNAYTAIPNSVMYITNAGLITGDNALTTELNGARAVIEISK